jgi:antitoxin component HigA of HigAB toxin-antitoxin module
VQKDLANVFGTPSIVPQVLNGKCAFCTPDGSAERDFCAPHASSGRELNKDHIKRLSRRFHVSPELFF